MAEERGFEPPMGLTPTIDFESTTLSHSEPFRKDHGGGFEFGYNRCLDSTQLRAQITAEKFLDSLDDCATVTRK